MPIYSPSLSPTLIARSFTYWSFRVTLISLLLRCLTIIALQTSLRISISTSISNYPLSPSTFSIFSYIIIIYPVIILRGVGSLYYRSAATAVQVRFAYRGFLFIFKFTQPLEDLIKGLLEGRLRGTKLAEPFYQLYQFVIANSYFPIVLDTRHV